MAASAIVPNGPVSLSLAKISYCSTAPQQATMTWTHVPNRDGIFAVFDTIRRRNIDGSVTEMRMLKIINRNEQLDQINLDNLREQARVEQEQSIYDEDKLVIVIVKKPLLALRYPLPNGQIRRVQLNFRPESGFDYAVNTLHLFDLPIRDKNFDNTTATSMGHHTRPHSAQAAVSNNVQRSSQERFNQVGGSRNYASIASMLPPAPFPSYAPTNMSLSYHRTLPLSGINQDDFSKPLLAHQCRPGWEDSIAFASQNSLPQANSLAKDPISETIDGVGDRPSDQSTQPPIGSWQWIPYTAERERPTTAPVTASARLAPETMTLSQMLPPDRILPFPEKKASEPPGRLSGIPKSAEQLPETDRTPHVKAKSTAHVKTKKSAKARRESSVSRSSLTPTRASTPYNLRPGSSSSNVGPFRSATSDSTLLSDAAKAPVRDRLAESKAKLSREGWILNEAAFLQYFDEEAFQNNAFFEELIKFARIERNFATAYAMLIDAQAARRSQTPRGHKFRGWMANDVKSAMKLYEKAAGDRNAELAHNVKANTPRKRIRAACPIHAAEEAVRPSRESTQDSIADETPTLPPPRNLTAKRSPVTRKRRAVTLDTNSVNPKAKTANTETACPPAHEQQTATETPPNAQLQPATTQPHAPLTPEQQILVTATPTAPPKPQPPQSLQQASSTQPPPPTISTASLPPPVTTTLPHPTTTTATTGNIIPIPPQADLLTLLNTWASTSPLFQPPPVLPQSSKDLLADFASKDDETRVQALDDMICECLEDENFSRLVKDVEGAWMRIGLGF